MPALWTRTSALAAASVTTKCAFDAIRLHRDLPECSKMVRSEDKFKAILPYMAKREIKIRFAKKEK